VHGVAIRAYLVDLPLIVVDSLHEVELAALVEFILAISGTEEERPRLCESDKVGVVIDGPATNRVGVLHFPVSPWLICAFFQDRGIAWGSFSKRVVCSTL
jgi:hypothetical protein